MLRLLSRSSDAEHAIHADIFYKLDAMSAQDMQYVHCSIPHMQYMQFNYRRNVRFF